MSTTDLQLGQISQVVFSIVAKGKKNNSLNSLTPRLVRNEVEKELGLSKNTLDVPKYKEIVKRAINDAMQSGQTQGESASGDRKKTGKNSSTPKAGESGRSPLLKSAKSKEIISDSDSGVEPTPSTSRSNVKSGLSAHADEESEPVRSSSKAKSSKVASGAAKRSSAATKTAQPEPKRKRASAPIVQSDSDVYISDTKPKVSSSSHHIPDKNKSDSEVSSLVDEPRKKKSRRKSASSDTGKPKAKSTRSKKPVQSLSKEEETIKELKTLVRACGVHKIWAKELNGLDLDSQIIHIRKILRDLGMKGRMSMEQATRIRDRREFAQELDDVQRFGRAIAAGKPFETDGTSKRVSKRGGDEDKKSDDASGHESDSASDRQQPIVNNARKSIMAFLQDQSSDDD
ncbi:hypothetical protein BJY52DRAFT_1186904 [Lactarius psammicola]|nr:hypothetical protein BJY52DRAFT_1186904 [Lactarius psammicola]